MIRFLLIITPILVPVYSFAFIEIQEIMYDHEDSDTGREWIELYHRGSSDIDISQWYFFEDDSYHRLTPETQSAFKPGSRAIISNNPALFVEEFGSDLLLIKSSFSLSNTGESLAIADEQKNIISEISYMSDMGANGDRHSLQLFNGQWYPAIPTPALANSRNLFNQDDTDDSVVDNNDSGHNNEQASDSDNIDDRNERQKKEFETYFEPYITFPKDIIAGDPARFRAGSYRISEDNKTRKLKGQYYLNFGDGSSITSSQRIDTEHVYISGGDYLVVFEYYNNNLSRDNGEEPTSLHTKKISVTNPDISISSNGETLIINNKSSQNLDMSNWKIEHQKYSFSFPAHSILLPMSELLLSEERRGFSLNEDEAIFLFNSMGLLIDSNEEDKSLLLESNILTPLEMPLANIEVQGYEQNLDTSKLELASEEISSSTSQSELRSLFGSSTNEAVIDFGESDNEALFDESVYSADKSLLLFASLAGLFALVLAFTRKQLLLQKNKNKDEDLEGEIELLDE